MCTTVTSGSKACARSSSLPYALWWRTSPPSLGSLPKRAWRRGRVHHGGGRHRHAGGHPSYVWHRRRAARRWLQASVLHRRPRRIHAVLRHLQQEAGARALPARAVPWTSGRRSFSDCSACVRFPSTRPEARRTRPSWCPTSPRPRPSGCAPSSTTARTLWPLRLPLRRAWRVRRVRPRRVWRVPGDRFRSRWRPALRLWLRGRRPLPATCRARPPRQRARCGRRGMEPSGRRVRWSCSGYRPRYLRVRSH